MSESDSSTTDKVFTRWIKLSAHLQDLSVPGRSIFSSDIQAYLQQPKGFEHRITRQLHPIYMLAYVLQPQHREDWTTAFMPKYRLLIDQFLTDYGGDLVHTQFYQYLDQQGPFNPTNTCWKTQDITLFWRISVRYPLFYIGLSN